MGKSDTNETWPMDELETVFVETLRKDEVFRALSPKRQQKMVTRVMKGSVKAFSKNLIDRAPKMLARRRKAKAGFEKRNLRRWREAFDLFETVWVCCEEIGRNFNQNFRPQAVQEQDFVFEAMTAIHARSLLVGEERICMMKGGFPDAAISRWRTLHELSVVAALLSRGGQDLALRYLAHADVQALKGLDAEAIAQDEDLRAVKVRADFGISRFGLELERTYGWACNLIGKKQPNFGDLEKKADKGEARYFYKFASQHIHSNHRAHNDLLGMSESRDTMLLVGPSNSGMVGPLTLGTMSLTEVTALYINTRPSFDVGIFVAVLVKMAGRMNKLGARLEKTTLKAARKKPKVAESRLEPTAGHPRPRHQSKTPAPCETGVQHTQATGSAAIAAARASLAA